MGFGARSVAAPGIPGTFWLKSGNVSARIGDTTVVRVARGGGISGAASIRVIVTGVWASPVTLTFNFADQDNADKTQNLLFTSAALDSGSMSIDPTSLPVNGKYLGEVRTIAVTDWKSVPSVQFTNGTAGSYSLTPHLGSAGVGRNITLAGGVLPAGVTLVNTAGAQRFDYDGFGAADLKTGIVLRSLPV